MKDKIILNIKDEIKEADKIALFTHTNCDCDGIGSMCALYEYLDENGKNVSMFCDSEIPDRYSFLKNFDKINKDALTDFDLMISLDTATTKRLGIYEEAYMKCPDNINIDHHASNPYYAKLDYVKPDYSSCGEVLYEIMKGLPYQITDSVATSLFSAITADTNQFSNTNVSWRTHIFAGELLKLGADANKVNHWLHKFKTRNQLQLAGYMAANLRCKNGVSYLLITQKVLKDLKVLSSDVSDFLSLISNVDDTKIMIVFKEKEKDLYRLNMRSIGNYDVNRVASVFDGGGHRNAAGCNMQGQFNKILIDVLKECYKEIDRVDRF